MKKQIIIVLFLVFSSTLYSYEFIESTGDILQIMIPVTAYTTTLILDDKEGRFQFYKTALSTFIITELLKYSVAETRPNGSNTRSFPSGHTSVSFMGAAFIHYRYGLKYGLPAYIAASFVGFSRVYSRNHYLHDVLASVIIGYGFSYLFTSRFKSVKLTPAISQHNNTMLYGMRIDFLNF